MYSFKLNLSSFFVCGTDLRKSPPQTPAFKQLSLGNDQKGPFHCVPMFSDKGFSVNVILHMIASKYDQGHYKLSYLHFQNTPKSLKNTKDTPEIPRCLKS